MGCVTINVQGIYTWIPQSETGDDNVLKKKRIQGIRKTFKELTIKDNFMFAAVMSDKENCRRLLEMVLGFPVKVVSVDYEYSIAYNPDYKGVRLDVLAADDSDSQYSGGTERDSKAKQVLSQPA